VVVVVVVFSVVRIGAPVAGIAAAPPLLIIIAGAPIVGVVLLVVVAVAMASVAAQGKVVHVEEPHRRSMLANGLGSAPPMGWNSWNHFQCDGNGEVVIRETGN
jgi:hypothetical protein